MDQEWQIKAHEDSIRRRVKVLEYKLGIHIIGFLVCVFGTFIIILLISFLDKDFFK